MAPEAWGTAISGVLTGLGGLILAWSGLRRTRNTQLREDLDLCWDEQQQIRSRFLEALEHVARLEEQLAARGIKVPMRPASLEPGRTTEQQNEWRPRHAAA
jgi:hypothetical protein